MASILSRPQCVNDGTIIRIMTMAIACCIYHLYPAPFGVQIAGEGGGGGVLFCFSLHDSTILVIYVHHIRYLWYIAAVAFITTVVGATTKIRDHLCQPPRNVASISTPGSVYFPSFPT